MTFFCRSELIFRLADRTALGRAASTSLFRVCPNAGTRVAASRSGRINERRRGCRFPTGNAGVFIRKACSINLASFGKYSGPMRTERSLKGERAIAARRDRGGLYFLSVIGALAPPSGHVRAQ